MVKFSCETRLTCDALLYINDKDTTVYKKFHVRRSPRCINDTHTHFHFYPTDFPEQPGAFFPQ
jgi:hypothetical protein